MVSTSRYATLLEVTRVSINETRQIEWFYVAERSKIVSRSFAKILLDTLHFVPLLEVTTTSFMSGTLGRVVLPSTERKIVSRPFMISTSRYVTLLEVTRVSINDASGRVVFRSAAEKNCIETF